MAADNLTAPLGFGKIRPRWHTRIPFGLIGMGLIGTLVVSAMIWVTIVDDPLGGEPNLVISLGNADGGVHHGRIAVVDDPAKSAAAASTDPVKSPGSETASEASEADEAPIPGSSLSFIPVKEITEKGPHGPLPKVADDGRRPVDLYAAPVRAEAQHLPKVVLVIGGLGLSQRGTQNAIENLPADITFAFAPYGASLDRWMRQARKSGHEVLLQLPLEPFDYPDNDPGPHTLLSALPAKANQERLHWILARLTNYTGVVNYMGARFTASEKALLPVLQEMRDRGLLYLDDGSSSRSTASRLAASAKTPFAKADLVVDTEPNAADIDARLLQLESIARSQGMAVGTASALPISIERIAEWSRTLEARGVYLVPASAAAKGR